MDLSEAPPSAALARLSGPGGFRFGFNLRPGGEGWMTPRTSGAPRLALRREAIGCGVAPGLVWSPDADGAWRAFVEWTRGALEADEAGAPRAAAGALAGLWAPDFLLLDRDGPGEPYRFRGGAVCFPSAWDPAEKLGLTVGEIHAPVPGLNAELGARIDRFLDGLRPGEVFERENWGLAATGALRLHPALSPPRLAADSGVEGAWFRLEEQAFVALPGGRFLLFLIHVRTWPLAEVARLPGLAAGLARDLESMPPAVAAYKGLAACRDGVVAGLRAGSWA